MSSTPATTELLRQERRRSAVLIIGLFVLLVGVYLLSFSGIYHSGDEVSYVRDAVEIIRDGSIDLGHGGPYALILAGGLILAEALKVVGPLQTLFLTNILSTALAAIFLFLIGKELKYDPRAALVVALLYGLASPAWVYSKQLFRDPVLAMAIIAMMYFSIRFRSRSSLVSLGLAMLFGIIAIATRPSTAIFAPFACVYMASGLWRRSDPAVSRRSTRTVLSVVAILVLAVVVGLVLLSVFNRYTKWLDRLLNFLDHRDALAGLLVSPGRGLLFYAPVVVLAIVALYRFARKHPWEAFLVCAPLPFYLVMVSAHPIWWGGWNWGPRYLIPIMPCLLLPLISIVEPLVVKPSLRWALVAAAVVVLISFVAQIVGVAIGPNTAAFESMQMSEFFAWSNSPFAQLTLPKQISPDLAWLYLDNSLASQLAVVVPMAALVLLGALLLWWGVAHPQPSPLVMKVAVISLVAALGVALWSLFWYHRHDTRYQTPDGFTAAINLMMAQAEPGDILVYDHWRTRPIVHAYTSLVDNACGYQCPPSIEVLREDIRHDRKFLEKSRTNGGRVWLLPGNLRSTSQAIEVQPWLDTYLFKADCQETGSGKGLCLYYTLPPHDQLSAPIETPRIRNSLGRSADRVYLPAVAHTTSGKRTQQTPALPKRRTTQDVLFGDRILLSDALLYWRAPEGQEPGERVITQPGLPVLVELVWQALAPIERRYAVSLQLLDSAGSPVHKVEREPLDGFWPTVSWQQGELFSDRIAFVLPAGLAAGDYQLVLQMVDPQTGAGLAAGSDNFAKLADVSVVAQP